MPAMDAIAEVIPPKGDEDMSAFYAVGLRATRDDEKHAVVVDVDADLTSQAATFALRRVTLQQYSDGSALVCEVDFTDDGKGQQHWSKSESFADAYARKCVVLMFKGAVIGVAPIEDARPLAPPAPVAPPPAGASAAPPGPASGSGDFGASATWLRENRTRHAGKWVALKGGELVAADVSRRAVQSRIADRSDLRDLLVVRIDGQRR